MHPMPREGTETLQNGHNSDLLLVMHPMPREGTETEVWWFPLLLFLMHPMPREGTETSSDMFTAYRSGLMHPMPREGTETLLYFYVLGDINKCILCPVRGRKPKLLLFVAAHY